ncbi:LytTR family DNA-binding domain-containing protein [Pseudidiomarina sp.]|uniref:LytTR family DNA-binding domain-containing protein n=1 Tax=Pseudidiomarina sp. TaxID=2081707 RepID=UPI00299F42AD|nr:LytTR family DNA-binding domain-containing protein [Pseudidiomarina sp.]MDX1706555.1 LytTR family DNA-binding domain-containing protein [Pseudidiomarina sp.]
MLILFSLSTVLSSFYHSWVFSDGFKSLLEFVFFALFFSLPFCLIIFPILFVLRQRWGIKTVPENEHRFSRIVTIKGESNDEDISFHLFELMYVKAQQNYVELVLKGANDDVVRQLVRITLQETEQQIPETIRVHRSYLVNPIQVSEVVGPKRKRSIKLKMISDEIPISSTYQKNIDPILPTQP